MNQFTSCLSKYGPLLFSLLLCFNLSAQQPKTANLPLLTQSGFLIGPGSDSFPVHKSWKNESLFMKDLDVYDRIVDRIETILCSQDNNKSVLLVGEPSQAYRYVFARLAMKKPESGCSQLWHLEIDINKIEAGHKFVGEVDKYWNENILEPAQDSNAVLYLRGLGQLIGIGSHSNDSTGIESEYVTNITSGKLKSIAFVDKYEYQYLFRSEHSYVISAFSEVINIPALDEPAVDHFLQHYIATFNPNLTLNPEEALYLIRSSAYYQPNVNEPERSLTILKYLDRAYGKPAPAEETFEFKVAAYLPGETKSASIEKPGATGIQIHFDYFNTQETFDPLKIVDTKTGLTLDIFSGNLGKFTTKIYPTDSISLVFTSRGSTSAPGFSISKVAVFRTNSTDLSRDKIRLAILDVAQVPLWIANKDWSIVRNLRKNLDKEVIGIQNAKNNVVRLAKVGYVAGRTDEKPVATLLFAGPTGTGKSYLAKKFAEAMKMNLITFDMTSFRTLESLDRFLTLMSDRLVISPYSVFLFEEIDKANPEILDRLFFMMDEGIFYDKNQRPLFARGSFIIMTTNAAKDVILQEKSNPNLDILVNQELQKIFRPSFLNRFDSITLFFPFSDAEYVELARILVNKKAERLHELFGWDVQVEKEVLEFLAKHGKSDQFGARPMERLVENSLGVALSEFQLMKTDLEEGDEISIRVVDPSKALFEISVTGKGVIEFTVDLTNNSGDISSGKFHFLFN